MNGWRLAACAAAVVVLQASTSARPPAVGDVVAGLDAYLVASESRLSMVVADETYEQRWTHQSGGRTVTETRLLESDFVFLKTPGDTPWFGLRDTYLVDGRPVRDRSGRLEQRLAGGDGESLSRALRIGEANARYNIGGVDRTINVPTQVLDLVHPRHAGRFRFALATDIVDGRPLWRIDFRETLRPALIRTPRGADEPATGSIWIDPADDEVIRTRLTATGGDSEATRIQTTITVDFAMAPALGCRVPTQMIETYSLRAAQIAGTATYSNFRRFRTAVRLLPPNVQAPAPPPGVVR